MMKSVITLFACIVFVSFNWGQQYQKLCIRYIYPKYGVGVEVSPGFSFIYGNPTISKIGLSAPSVSAGISFQYMLFEGYRGRKRWRMAPKFWISTYIGSCINYERKGVVSTPSSFTSGGLNFGDTTVYNKFDYLTIPVFFRFKVNTKRGIYNQTYNDSTKAFRPRANFFFKVGPYVGILLNHEEVYESASGDSKIYNRTESYKRVDLGAMFGMGIEIKTGSRSHLYIEFRNNLGFYNINQVASIYSDPLFNNSSQLVMGFSFGSWY